jgi:1-acyl-sn-glycerol-3-phosphate acyltransferase
VPRWVTRLLFARAFTTYGLIAMPPPYASAAERSTSMRAAVRELRQGAVLGIMPEGTVGETPELLPAAAGVGAFLLVLSRTGAPVLPVGLYEEGGRLVVHFGEPYRLITPAGLEREAADEHARHQIMAAIRDLLPDPLRGAYRSPD